MKAIPLFSLVLFTSMTAAFSQIPNNDFENWTNVSLWEQLDDWWSNYGDFVAVSLSKNTDAYSGTYAAHLGNYAVPSYMFAGFGLVSHPHYITVYAKTNVVANDSVWMKIILYSNGLP